MSDSPPLPPGFTPHKAGPCPVDRDTFVIVQFADGQTSDPMPASFWSEEQDWWQHKGGPACAIVAYIQVEDEFA